MSKKDILDRVDISMAASKAWQKKLAKCLVGLMAKDKKHLVEEYDSGRAIPVGYEVDRGILRLELAFDPTNSLTLDIPPQHWRWGKPEDDEENKSMIILPGNN